LTAAADFDCIVIGAGHNGLVCAAYLARSGRSVLVLEAASEVGGAAITREFAPGFRVSAGAHLLQLMPRSMIEELALRSHGLVFAGEDLQTVALSSEGAPLTLDALGLAGLPAAEQTAHADLIAQLQRFGRALAPVLNAAPPRLGTSANADRLALLKLGWQIRRLGRRDMRELLRIGGMCVYDLLQENLSTPLLQGAMAFDAVLGTNFGPRAPGSVFTLLCRMAAAANADRMAPALPQGGLGALSKALAASARSAGATIRTDATVQRIRVERDRAVGVTLSSGESISAGLVVSNADPKTTFLGLLGSEHLDTGFVRRVVHLRSRGLAAKLHLALDRLPPFRGLDGAALGGRLLVAPSLDYIERAYNHSKYGEYSAAPSMEITLPTVRDPQLAPAGAHVLSAVVQYVPYAVTGGWESARARLVDSVVEQLDAYAPGLRRSVLAAELLTPHDIEQQFRIFGGHWHHGELALDQFLMVRPVPGAAQYATPLAGLYLCGAGSHPGGGIMGTAGRNAARAILARAA
jgi:phytoene dehydrogenase-like protein